MIGEWVRLLPANLLERKMDGLDRAGMMDVRHVAACGRQLAELLKTLETELELDAEQVKRLRTVPGSPVPLFKATEGGE